jgi:hypothetical protein
MAKPQFGAKRESELRHLVYQNRDEAKDVLSLCHWSRPAKWQQYADEEIEQALRDTD